MCIATVRRLKPGTYELFRAAWEPNPWPRHATHALHLRNDEHPDEVCSLLFLDLTPEGLEALRDSPDFTASEAARIKRVSAHELDVVLNSVYEVVEEVRPPQR